jgi:hypothetical protein
MKTPNACSAPAVITFPALHSPGGGPPLQHILKVTAPTDKLTLEIAAGNPIGGGAVHTVTIRDDRGEELQSRYYNLDATVKIELNNLQPGLYAAVGKRRFSAAPRA